MGNVPDQGKRFVDQCFPFRFVHIAGSKGKLAVQTNGIEHGPVHACLKISASPARSRLISLRPSCSDCVLYVFTFMVVDSKTEDRNLARNVIRRDDRQLPEEI